MSIESATDHWAFLEEIEAPMWADLGAESKLINQDLDDDWFHRVHKFHQFSSHKLRSFSRSGIGSLEASSLALPQSVTKSRGSDYKSKKWGRSNHDVSFSKQVVKDLNGNSSEVSSGSGKLKNQLRPSSTKSRSYVISGDAKGRVNSLKPQVTCTSERDLSGVTSVENSGKNTVTSGCIDQQQQRPSKETRTSGKKGVLQSAVEISIQKSFVNRPALRAETSHCKEQSRDRQSCSRKSSVGSSSNPGNGLKCSGAGLMKKEQTTDRCSVVKIKEAGKHESKVPMTCDAPGNRVKGCTLSSRKVLANITNHTSWETSKSKVQIQSQTFSSKVMMPQPLHIDKQKLSAGSFKDRKVQVNKHDKIGSLKVCQANSAANRIGGFRGQGERKGEPYKIGSKMHLVAPKQVKVSSRMIKHQPMGNGYDICA